MIRSLLTIVTALAASVTLAAPDQRAAEMLERAQASLAVADGPRERLAALGQAAQAQEAALASLRDDLRRLSTRSRGLERILATQRREHRAILSALQRLERSPRVAALAHPDGAVSAARAGGVFAAFAPALQKEADALRIALASLTETAALRETAEGEARASLAALHSLRAEISTLLRQNRRAKSLPAETAARLKAEADAIARSAQTLRALAAALPALQRPDRSPRFSAARGALPPPVEGEIRFGFGEDDGEGPLRGVKIAAPAYAEIYAPWGGVIRFSGAYADYGEVVILEPEAGALIIFAGLAQRLREAGEVVLAGEPLGALGGPTPQAEEFLIASTSAVEPIATETLYIEVRRNGKPADPADWFVFETKEGDGT